MDVSDGGVLSKITGEPVVSCVTGGPLAPPSSSYPLARNSTGPSGSSAVSCRAATYSHPHGSARRHPSVLGRRTEPATGAGWPFMST